MKKKGLILSAMMLAAVAGVAQETVVAVEPIRENKTDFRERMLIGGKLGGNYSSVYQTSGEAFHADPKFGWAGGLFLAIPIGKNFGVHPEILYSQKGFKATGSILGSPYKFTRTTSYIDVPIFFALKPTEFITLLAGPQYSYLLKQRDEFATAFTTREQEQEFVNDNIHNNTLCFAGGLDINLKHMVIGARVAWDVRKNREDGSSTTPRYKNSWYQATIGYRLYN